MNRSKNGPIFIVGAPRSGTTLLQRMLRCPIPESPPPQENHILSFHFIKTQQRFVIMRDKSNLRKVLQEMYRISPDFLDTDFYGMRFDIDELTEEFHAQGYVTIPAVISGIFRKNAHGEGKYRWLDKTPYYILQLPKIREMFPDSQIIHIIRDGRDCTLSMIVRKHDLKVYNVYHAAKLWQQYVEAGQEWGSKAGPEVYLEFRYEDLLAAPVATVRKVCAFLCEPFSDSVINFQKSKDKKTKTPLLQKPLQGDNTEKWRKLMTPWQIRIFEGEASNTLISNGYPLSTNGKPLPLFLRAAYRLHNRIATFYNRIFHNVHR